MVFQPGQSGNPGGRSKKLQRLEKKLDGLADKALRVIDAAMDHPDVNARLAAAKMVADRVMPVPRQAATKVQIAVGGGHAAALRVIAEKRQLTAVDVQATEVTATPLDRVSDSE